MKAFAGSFVDVAIVFYYLVSVYRIYFICSKVVRINIEIVVKPYGEHSVRNDLSVLVKHFRMSWNKLGVPLDNIVFAIQPTTLPNTRNIIENSAENVRVIIT